MKFISSKPYELTVITFDLFCATGLLKRCVDCFQVFDKHD